MKKAVIFDMDGVISNTQKYHAKVEIKLLKHLGIHISKEELQDKYAGVSDEEMFIKIFQKKRIQAADIPALVLQKWKLLREIANGKIEAIPHAILLINALKKNGYKLAVASASPHDFIIYVLKSLKVLKKFDAIVSSQEVKHGKPAPDIFLLAAKRLAVLPKDAIVIEDGRSGMIGAKRAYMKCIGLVSEIKSDYPATMLVTSLDQVHIEDISALK